MGCPSGFKSGRSTQENNKRTSFAVYLATAYSGNKLKKAHIRHERATNGPPEKPN